MHCSCSCYIYHFSSNRMGANEMLVLDRCFSCSCMLSFSTEILVRIVHFDFIQRTDRTHLKRKRKMASNLFYCAVLLKSKQNVVLPAKWCPKLDIAEAMNEGLNRNKNHLIFYSKDVTMELNFEMPVNEEHTSNLESDGCFWAKIVKIFG